VLLGASVAHIGGHLKFFTDILTKDGAEVVASLAGAASSAALEISAHIHFSAVMPVHAAVRHTPERALVTVDAAFFDLARDGRVRLSDFPSDFLVCFAVSKPVLDEQALGVGQM
jgi:hypothetical protein